MVYMGRGITPCRVARQGDKVAPLTGVSASINLKQNIFDGTFWERVDA
jgi:hypothetical protein